MANTPQWVPDLENCPPSLLRTLLTFAEKGSVSETADHLKLDQPTVSRRLQAFLRGRPGGGPLLERAGKRRLQLTARGEALLPRIREAVTHYEELLEHLLGLRR